MYRIEYDFEVLPEITEMTDDTIIAEFEAGNVWAWCMIKVTARINGIIGLEGTEYLNCCTFKDEEEFRKSNEHGGMRRCALTEFRVKLSEIHEATHHLSNFDRRD